MTARRPAGKPAVDVRGASDPAARAWQLMSGLVLDQNRKAAVSEALGMSFARIRALRRLAAAPLTLRQLAAMLNADPPYVTLMVDDLEERGFAERTVHPDDRRAKLVQLTPAGRRAAAQANAILDEPPAALRDLSPDDAAALLEILERLRGDAPKRI